MAQSDVSLTSNLNEGNIAYDTQTVTFRCTIRGSVLTWSSEEYVGFGGYTLQFASVHSAGRTNTSVRVPTTTATLISTTENGETVLVSQLRIIATVQHPTSSVTCRVYDRGAENTISFRKMYLICVYMRVQNQAQIMHILESYVLYDIMFTNHAKARATDMLGCHVYFIFTSDYNL